MTAPGCVELDERQLILANDLSKVVLGSDNDVLSTGEDYDGQGQSGGSESEDASHVELEKDWDDTLDCRQHESPRRHKWSDLSFDVTGSGKAVYEGNWEGSLTVVSAVQDQ